MDEVALALEGEEWEQEACEPEERYRERPGVEAPQTAGEGAGGTWSGVLTLQLSADGAGEDDGPGGGEGNGGRGALRPVQRRASAADKELAQALHRTHLLCLLARALALDHATTSPLLQAAMLSIVPLNLQPSPSAGAGSLDHVAADLHGDEADRDTLLRLSAWFRKTFTLRPAVPAGGSQGDEKRPATVDALLAALERRGGTAEEVGALSVALLRALGLASRLVVMLEPLPLKPSTAFLKESMRTALDCTRKRLLAPRAQVVRHETLLADDRSGDMTAGPVQADGDWRPDSERERASARKARGGRQLRACKGGGNARGSKGQGKKDGMAGSRAGDTATATRCAVDSARQAEIRRSRAATGNGDRGLLVTAEEPGIPGTIVSSCKKRRGDEEFELQMALAMAATARPPREGVPEEVAADVQGMGGALRKGRRVAGSSLHRAAAIWSQEFGDVSHWAEVYCREPRSRVPKALAWADVGPLVAAVSDVASTGGRPAAAGPAGPMGRWVHWDAARGVVDGEGKVEGLVAGQGQELCYVVACAGGGAKDVTKRYAALWSRVAPRRDEDWWQATLAPLLRLEAEAGSRKEGRAGSGPDVTQQPVHASALPNPGSQEGRVPSHDSSRSTDSVDLASGLPAASSLFRSSNKDRSGGKGVKGVGDPGSPVAAEPHSARTLERGSLEDMELDIKTLTEPLPTSQQAYRTHPLYVLERWLGKYQALHPRGPVLGLCGGQPVFPRTCVKQLHTRRRWLAEGRSVKEGERRFKVVEDKRCRGVAPKGSLEARQGQETRANASTTGDMHPFTGEGPRGNRIGQREGGMGEGDGGESGGGCGQGEPGMRSLELFGEWQTEPFKPPSAENGRVPKNEWGQVDLWSEAMLPGGTVHLRYPGIARVAHRLGFDFAPAMVGFEMRAGQPMPKVEGVVVCVEHAEAIMDAFFEEERVRKETRLRRRSHAALLRWRDLLQALLLRQELKERYESEESRGAHEVPANSTLVERHGTITVDRLGKPDGLAASTVHGSLATSLMATNGVRPVGSIAEGAAEDSCMRSCKDSSLKPCEVDAGQRREEDTRSIAPASVLTLQATGFPGGEGHVHEFWDHEPEGTSGLRTRECKCGFRIEVEEM